MKKIDVHTHIGNVDNWKLSLTLDYLENNIMPQNNIEKSVIMPFFKSTDNDPKLNESLMNKTYNNEKFFFFYWVNPLNEDININKYINHIQKNRKKISGIKFHPSISQICINDKKLKPLFEYCNDEKLPILIHSGRADISDAKYVKELALEYNNMNFIIAHLAGGVFDKIMEAINFYSRELPANIYFDTAQTTHSILLRRAIDTFGIERIVFGSDIPFIDINLVMYIIENIGLTEKEKSKIYFNNALRILNGT